MAVLKRFNITFDYVHATLYLEKNSNYDRPVVCSTALAWLQGSRRKDRKSQAYLQTVPRQNPESLRAM